MASYANKATETVLADFVNLLDKTLQEKDFFLRDPFVDKPVAKSPYAVMNASHRETMVKNVRTGLASFAEQHKKGLVFVNDPDAMSFSKCWQKPTEAVAADLEKRLADPAQARAWAAGQAMDFLGFLSYHAVNTDRYNAGVGRILAVVGDFLTFSAHGQGADQILAGYRQSCAGVDQQASINRQMLSMGDFTPKWRTLSADDVAVPKSGEKPAAPHLMRRMILGGV